MTGRGYRLLPLLSLAVLLSLAGPSTVAATGVGPAGNAGDDYIVVFRPGVSAPLQLTRALERMRGFTATRSFRQLKAFSARLTHRQLEALRAHPSVAFVDQVRRFRAAGSESLASGESVPTGIRRIQAMEHGRLRGPSGVNVAVLDTGIQLGHPDLNAVHGTNCINSARAYDDRGHGTLVASTIAARNNGANLVGAAPGTRLVSVKVLDSNFEGTTESLICGIEWVTSTLTDSDPTNDIAVANMSVFGRAPAVRDCAVTDDALHRAICASTAAGVTYVVSAGNTGAPFDHPDRKAVVPAAYPEVLTATAMADSDGRPGGLGKTPKCKHGESDDQAATFSSFAVTEVGAGHTIAAPGVCIKSMGLGGYYWTGFGTSFTAPHVTAAVALCINDGGTPGPCAGLTPAEVIQKMRADAGAWTTSNPEFGFGGDPSRPTGNRYYGYLVRVGVEQPAGNEEAALAPSSVTIKKGANAGGGNARLAADDDSYLEIRSTARYKRTTAFIARFSNVARDAQSLSIAYSGRHTRGCTQDIALRDVTTGRWVGLDSRVVGPAEVLIDLALPAPPARFISGSGATGEVRVRVRCRTTAGRFYAAADFMQLSVTRP